MSSQTASSRFLETLRKSRLLSDEEIDSFVQRRNLASADDAQVAREFLKAQLLTAFQAKYLMHGRWRGLVIGSYRISEPISAGGMGEVYLARHPGQDTSVAIKVLRSELRNQARSVERFRLEAFAVMTLEHPNLLRGIEYDRIEQFRHETYYLVTEFVQGPNLYELTVIRRLLPWQQACDIVSQAALGLHHAHEHGFVHRDVKPGNLILSSSGVAKVVDFGLAQYTGDDESFHFSMRKRRGTQRYAAPEQSISEHPIDRRADVYSLGCTLFYALSGRPPSDSSSDLFPSSNTAIVRLLEHRKDLPDELLLVIKRMLRRKPEQRFESGEAVAAALQPFCKRLSVDINYPALVRARERSRQSEASWNTDVSVAGTTHQAEPNQSAQSKRAALLSAFAPVVPAASEVSTGEGSLGDSAGGDPASVVDRSGEGDEGLDRFAEIYRRHRQHVDRLYQRIASLEESLRESQAEQTQLKSQVNAKEIRCQQLLAENREIVELLRDQPQVDDPASTDALDELHEQIRRGQADHQAERLELTQRAEQLQSQLDQLAGHLEIERAQWQQEMARIESEHAEQINRMQQTLADSDAALANRTRDLDARNAARERSAQRAISLRRKLRDLEQQTQAAIEERQQAMQLAEIEVRKRQLAEDAAQAYAKHLRNVARHADELSLEATAAFARMSLDDADATFFQNYEAACESPGDEPPLAIDVSHNELSELDELSQLSPFPTLQSMPSPDSPPLE